MKAYTHIHIPSHTNTHTHTEIHVCCELPMNNTLNVETQVGMAEIYKEAIMYGERTDRWRPCFPYVNILWK